MKNYNQTNTDQTSSTIALILGGGKGTRLFPLTERRSKPAVPIAGKYRLVDIPISNCINSKILRMFVLTQFNSASLNKHISKSYHFDAFTKGFVDILAAEQTPLNPNWYQGTADAVRQSIHHLESHKYDYVLILSGDQLYQMDYGKMLSYHVNSNADITIATIPVKDSDASDFGIMKTNKNKKIISFIEKPSLKELMYWSSPVDKRLEEEGRVFLASMGIYIFKKRALIDLLNEFNDSTDFGKEIIPNSIKNKNVVSYSFDGYWTDIGTIKSFFKANLLLTDKLPKFKLFEEDFPIYTRARMLAPAKIDGSRLEKTVVSEGCIVENSNIKRCILGIRTKIDLYCTIENVYIMGNDEFQSPEKIESLKRNKEIPLGVGRYSIIKNAILDRNCAIGENVQLIGGNHLSNISNEMLTVNQGIIVIKKGAVIPNGYTLGVD